LRTPAKITAGVPRTGMALFHGGRGVRCCFFMLCLMRGAVEKAGQIKARHFVAFNAPVITAAGEAMGGRRASLYLYTPTPSAHFRAFHHTAHLCVSLQMGGVSCRRKW